MLMTVDDRTRLDLHRKLDAMLGSKEADTLMAHLPPVTWQDVATTNDVRTLETTLRAEMRAEFADVRAEMRAEFAEVRTEMRVGFADVRTDMHRSMVEQTRWIIGFICAWSAVVVTIAKLIL